MENSSNTSSAQNLLLTLNASYSKAILTDEGILIQSEHNICHSITEQSDSKEDTAGRSESSTSLISCIACLDDLENETSIENLIPMNTLIPYGRILNARYLNESKVPPNKFCADIRQPSSSSNISSRSSTKLMEEGQETNKELRTPFLSENENGEQIESFQLKNFDRNEYSIELSFVIPSGDDIVAKKINLSISYIPSMTTNKSVVEEIMLRSYKNVNRNRSILVIINPHGGKGKAKLLFEKKAKPILIASNCSLEIIHTKYSRHALDIAKDLDITKYDVIACASGDGIPYEVINGLYQRPDRADAFNKLTITQVPCGSGNAMSISCHWTDNPSHAALCLLKSVERRIDLMCCSQVSYMDDCPRLSFLSQTFGVIAESDINTEFIRWMGPIRFNLGVAYNVFQGKKYPCDIFVRYASKSKQELKDHYLKHKRRAELESERSNERVPNSRCKDPLEYTVTEGDFELKYPLRDGIPDDWERLNPEITENLNIFYTGKMPYISADTNFFPAALPSDGTFDLIITDVRTPITKITPILLSLDKGSHVLHPEVIHSKITAYKMIPKISDSIISVDGERFPVEPLQVEIMPKLCKTLLRNGCYVDSKFYKIC